MHVSEHFMYIHAMEATFLHVIQCMHETLLPCMNHDWFMHGEIKRVKHACFKEIGIIYAYNMHVTCIHA